MELKQKSARSLLKAFAATFASRDRKLDASTVRLLAPFAEDVAREIEGTTNSPLVTKCLPTARATVSIVTGQDIASFDDYIIDVSVDDIIIGFQTHPVSLVFMDFRANAGNPMGHSMCYYIDNEFDVVVRIHSQGNHEYPCFAFFDATQSVDAFTKFLGVPATVDEFIHDIRSMVSNVDDCIPIMDSFTLHKVAAKGSRIKVLPAN